MLISLHVSYNNYHFYYNSRETEAKLKNNLGQGLYKVLYYELTRIEW